MRLQFVDASSAVVRALREAFAEHRDVTVRHGDILALAHGALVSPANSHGFMDGGFDQQYAAFFEAVVQERVLDVVRARPEGHLPVGAASVVPTDHPRIPFLVVAPTNVRSGPGGTGERVPRAPRRPPPARLPPGPGPAGIEGGLSDAIRASIKRLAALLRDEARRGLRDRVAMRLDPGR